MLEILACAASLHSVKERFPWDKLQYHLQSSARAKAAAIDDSSESSLVSRRRLNMNRLRLKSTLNGLHLPEKVMLLKFTIYWSGFLLYYALTVSSFRAKLDKHDKLLEFVRKLESHVLKRWSQAK
ncbi:uncharacterized protein A4U43_C07F1190 [Asparagus officinalis]|uniref:Uncharacterized protein n=1 Tax=Asparagus officinalis TaxID=4686 RepID=A0A5P1E8K9_ASPOF|nr:uncharacterized protein A4U43_C07F1190 [Asparagus officinalis]